MSLAEAYLKGKALREDTSRKERQDQLTALQQGFEMNTETGQYEQYEQTQSKQIAETLKEQQLQATLDATQAQLKSQQSRTNSDDMKSIMDSITNNDMTGAKAKLRKNKVLQEKLAGKALDTHDMGAIDWDRDLELFKQSGLGFENVDLNSPEIRDALDSSYFKVRGADGRDRLASTSDVYAQTNQWADMDAKERDRYTDRMNYVNSVLKGSGLTTAQERQLKAEEQLQATKTAGAQTVSTQVNKDMETFFSDPKNANATYADFQRASQVAPAMDPMKAFDYKEKMSESFAMKNSKAITNDIINTSSDFSQDQINAAKHIQGKAKLNNKDADLFSANYNTVKGLTPLYKAISKIDSNDWNALAKLNTEAVKVGGSFWTDMASMTESEKEAVYSKMGINAQLQTVAAGYIKAMSGAAVTESERAFYNDAINGGAWSTKAAAMSKMKGFMSQQMKDFQSNSERISYNYPKDYIVQKRLFNNANKEFEKVTDMDIEIGDIPVAKKESSTVDNIKANAKNLWNKYTGGSSVKDVSEY